MAGRFPFTEHGAVGGRGSWISLTIHTSPWYVDEPKLALDAEVDALAEKLHTQSPTFEGYISSVTLAGTDGRVCLARVELSRSKPE